MTFKEEYQKFSGPSSAREALVLKTLLSLPKEQIVKNMRAITTPGPNGTKLTYYVMPDYISVDGMRVPMAGNTAATVAQHFNLNLPTKQMVDEIHQNANVKVSAKPLSGSGVSVGGENYSAQGVVDKGVGYAPFAVAYNDRINKQLSESGAKPDDIVSGFAKDIIAPPKSGSLGLYGMYDSKGNPIQGGDGVTSHDTNIHTEYGSFVRLVSPTVTVTYPDGHTEEKPTEQMYPSASYKPLNKKEISDISKSPSNLSYDINPQQQRLLKQIDDTLSQFSLQATATANQRCQSRMQLLQKLYLNNFYKKS